MFDAVKFYQDYSIQYISSGHKHARPGWVQIKCPFCTGNPGWHLGFCTDDSNAFANRYICYRCGSHSISSVIKEIVSCSWHRAMTILNEYSNDLVIRSTVKSNVQIRRNTKLELPLGTKEMGPRHKNYLASRNFDPDKLEYIWSLKGTGPIGEYCHRIIIPIYFQNVLVSYQGRDITGLCEEQDKYRDCHKENEIISHKQILYGLDKIKKEIVLVVEGAADAWRMGEGCVATFGIKFKMAQAAILNQFKRVFILFDPEEQAQSQARKIQALCSSTDVELIEWQGEEDPGEMSQDDADHLMKYLGIN